MSKNEVKELMVKIDKAIGDLESLVLSIYNHPDGYEDNGWLENMLGKLEYFDNSVEEFKTYSLKM